MERKGKVLFEKKKSNRIKQIENESNSENYH